MSAAPIIKIGKTTLFTTCFICDEAVLHVPSIAPATSPSANAQNDIALIVTIIMTAIKIIFVVLFFIKSHPFCCLMRWTYVPIIKDIALNCNAVGQICGKHSRGRPTVYCPSINLVIPIGIPDRRKMRPIIIGTILIFSEFKSAARFLQQTPIGLVIEFGKVYDAY